MSQGRNLVNCVDCDTEINRKNAALCSICHLPLCKTCAKDEPICSQCHEDREDDFESQEESLDDNEISFDGDLDE